MGTDIPSLAGHSLGLSDDLGTDLFEISELFVWKMKKFGNFRCFRIVEMNKLKNKWATSNYARATWKKISANK